MNFVKLNNGNQLNLDHVVYIDQDELKAYVDAGAKAVVITSEDFIKIENYLFRKQIFDQERRCKMKK